MHYDINFPEKTGLSQGEEYFLFHQDGKEKRIGLHDYQTIYKYPMLYEALLYETLKCRTPSEICNVLNKVWEDRDKSKLHMLEIGAGSGIFAEYLRKEVGITDISGLDIYEEAKQAAERDRPSLYSSYYVCDLTDLQPEMLAELQGQQFNCIGVASATGWGNHIPLKGFEQAFDLLAPGGWFIFHVKPNDPDPECVALNQWIGKKIDSKELDVRVRQSCFHRKGIDGTPIYYDVVVGVRQ
jgi:SAM-dependent methyltransferase